MKKMQVQCEQKDYVNAQRFMMEAERCHSREKNFAYQNCVQESYVASAKMRKR